MQTNRLSTPAQDILNRQLALEARAAQIYLAYGVWADDAGYTGLSNLLFRHSGEERDHMMKAIEYIQQRGGRAQITAVEAPLDDPSSMMDCCQKLLEHEIENTEAIYEIVELAHKEKDWATWNFAQWFVKEQTEEETLLMNLVERVKKAGGEDATADARLYLDDQFGAMADEADLARDANVDAP